MRIRFAKAEDIPEIHRLANEIWPVAYQGIIPDEQIGFMLIDMYSIESLTAQFNQQITFLIAESQGDSLGFASYSRSPDDADAYKIHKLYILPDRQRKGCGKALCDFIAAEAKNKGARILELNVNRNNPAFYFYQHYGFELDHEVDIPYNQFILNDFLMRLIL
jgi:diamine N-acetyltransferase